MSVFFTSRGGLNCGTTLMSGINTLSLLINTKIKHIKVFFFHFYYKNLKNKHQLSFMCNFYYFFPHISITGYQLPWQQRPKLHLNSSFLFCFVFCLFVYFFGVSCFIFWLQFRYAALGLLFKRYNLKKIKLKKTCLLPFFCCRCWLHLSDASVFNFSSLFLPVCLQKH